MKKLLSLILAGAMCLSLVACSSDEAETTTTTEGEEAPLRVALIVSTLGDKSFNDSANEGLERGKEELGYEYKVFEIGVDAAKAQPSLVEVSEEGYDVIACNNLGFGQGAEWLEANAASYPDTTYLFYDDPTVTFEHSNIISINFRANESDFLAGALAASMSETGVLGFIGGQDNQVIGDFLVGYIQGAQYINPEVKMVVSYTENWQDAPKGKELGLSAIDAGADVIHPVAGGAGTGAIEAASENDLFVIGVDADQYEAFKTAQPELAENIITSSIKTVGDALYDQVTKIIDGTAVGGNTAHWYGINEGAAGIVKNENYLAKVPAEVQTTIDELEAKVISGEIEVKSYFDMTTEEYEAMKASVIG